jgi:hypothetical protein
MARLSAIQDLDPENGEIVLTHREIKGSWKRCSRGKSNS